LNGGIRLLAHSRLGFTMPGHEADTGGNVRAFGRGARGPARQGGHVTRALTASGTGPTLRLCALGRCVRNGGGPKRTKSSKRRSSRGLKSSCHKDTEFQVGGFLYAGTVNGLYAKRMA
jgi:hypothetical protein